MSEHAASTSVVVPLTHGYEAVIDADDAERVLAHRWRAFVHANGYVEAQATINRDGRRTLVALHRFILDAPDGIEVDHRNRRSLDCQKRNLRLATRIEQLRNRRGWSSCGFKGVDFDRTHWRARIKLAGRRVFLGAFATPEDAARAYDAAAREAFGEFAFLNFPDITE